MLSKVPEDYWNSIYLQNYSFLVRWWRRIHKDRIYETSWECGIIHQLFCPGTPKENRVVERKHRHIVETSLTILFHAEVPTYLCVEAFATAVFSLTKCLHQFCRIKVHFRNCNLKVFGCQSVPYLQNKTSNKFQPRTYPCLLDVILSIKDIDVCMFLLDVYTYLDMLSSMEQPCLLLKELIYHFFKNRLQGQMHNHT